MSTKSMSFGDRLRSAREMKKLSQAELAKLAGLQPSHISHFETDRRSPSADNLRALADALNVATDYLLGRQANQGVVGPKFDQVITHAEHLSDADLDVLSVFAETLAERYRSGDRRKQ